MPDEGQEALLRQYAPLVQAQARRLARVAQAAGMTEEDLVQIGRLALVEARAAYDADKGGLTGWLLNSVQWSLLRAIRAAGPLVSGIPQNAPERLKPVRLFSELEQAPLEAEDALPFEERIEDPEAGAAFATVEDRLCRECLLSLLPLPVRQAAAMAMDGATLEEIGRELGYTKETARNRLIRARKLWRQKGITARTLQTGGLDKS